MRSFATRVGMRVKFIVMFPVASLSIKKIPGEAKRRRANVIYTPRARIPRARRQFRAFQLSSLYYAEREFRRKRDAPVGAFPVQLRSERGEPAREQSSGEARIINYSIAIIVAIAAASCSRIPRIRDTGKYRFEGRNSILSFYTTSIFLC